MSRREKRYPERLLRSGCGSGTERNQWALNHRSHLALIPIEKLFANCNDILIFAPQPGLKYTQFDDPFEHPLENPVVISFLQRYPGPDEPKRKIPASEWPNVVRRVVENQEPLRKVAEDYGVSYETIRRVIQTTSRKGNR